VGIVLVTNVIVVMGATRSEYAEKLVYVHRGFTAQSEVTLVQSVRVRGDEMSTDPASTRASFGLHLGYLVGWR